MKKKSAHFKTLQERFPPSAACSCEVCQSYCQRPGWWTVEEAQKAMLAGYGDRMMLEISPEFTFGVLSPAFRGCEGNVALKEFQKEGCTFLSGGLCTLHSTGLLPLECRFCHHSRIGQGIKCHEALEQDWRSQKGQALVSQWAQRMGLWNRYGMNASKGPSK